MAYYDEYYSDGRQPVRATAVGRQELDKEPTFGEHFKRVLAFERTPMVRAPPTPTHAAHESASPPRSAGIG
jgi:hypothetical protein